MLFSDATVHCSLLRRRRTCSKVRYPANLALRVSLFWLRVLATGTGLVTKHRDRVWPTPSLAPLSKQMQLDRKQPRIDLHCIGSGPEMLKEKPRNVDIARKLARGDEEKVPITINGVFGANLSVYLPILEVIMFKKFSFRLSQQGQSLSITLLALLFLGALLLGFL